MEGVEGGLVDDEGVQACGRPLPARRRLSGIWPVSRALPPRGNSRLDCPTPRAAVGLRPTVLSQGATDTHDITRMHVMHPKQKYRQLQTCSTY